MNTITKKPNSKNITRYKQLAFALSLGLLSSLSMHGTAPNIEKELFERTNKGHIDAMRKICCKKAKEFLKTKKFQDYKELCKWLFRTNFHIVQDSLCCRDNSVKKIKELRMGLEETNLLVKLKESSSLSEDTTKQLTKEAAYWVQNLTTNKELPEPYEVANDSIEVSFWGTPKEKVFLPKEQWQEKRQNIIDKACKQLTNTSKLESTE